jgi:hypothetical protein
MATIVNDRDVLLQAATSRVAGVTMTNLSVDQSQVTGLGLVLTGVKRITSLVSEQVFLVPTVGSITPSQVTISVTVSNFAATPVMTVVSGTLSPIPTAVNGVFTIPASSLSATTVVRISATDVSVTPNVTYTDDITLLRQVEGSSTVVGVLTQEDITLTADSLGNVTNYYGASGNFKVYQGTNNVTSLCTFSLVSNTSGLTQTMNATTGAYAITAGFPSGSTTTATVTYRATFGSTTVDKTITIRKSTATTITNGTNGQRGSRTFYVTLSGSTATYSDSLATTTASVDGGPIRNDVVTQSNASVGFSQSKFWDGTVWNTINAVVDGNLLVTGTVGANKMAANLMQSDNVLTRGLTVRDMSGNIILQAGGAIDWTKLNGGLTNLSGMGYKTYRVISSGASSTTTPSPGGGFYDAMTGISAALTSRSYNLAVLDKTTGSILASQTYDVYGNGALTSGRNAASLASDLNGFTSSVVVVIWCFDEPQTNRTAGGLPAALYRCGATKAVFESSKFKNRGAYILVGIPGCGEGNATFEQYSGVVDADTSAWVDMSFSVVNGNVMTGAAGSSLFEINSSNVTTYIASAAIGALQVSSINANQVSATSLSAITATIGTLRTATSGQRTEIQDNKILVYDSSNQLRVKIGDLS